MSKAVLTLTNGSHKVVEPAKALRYYQILHGLIDDPTVEEQEKVMYIKHIALPPSHRPSEYVSVITSKFNKNPINLVTRPVDDENSRKVTETTLFHEGREQGMYQAIPTGDQ